MFAGCMSSCLLTVFLLCLLFVSLSGPFFSCVVYGDQTFDYTEINFELLKIDSTAFIKT